MRATAMIACLAALILATSINVQAAEIAEHGGSSIVGVTPRLTLPVNDATRTTPTPSFTWEPVAGADHYEIQIARDAAFSDLVDCDVTRVPRYVCEKPLPDGTLYWRIRAVTTNGQAGKFSDAGRFSIQQPTHVYDISNKASAKQIEGVIAEAAADTPAIVRFAKGGQYRIKPSGKCAIILSGTKQLIIDGQGAELVITDPSCGFTSLHNCEGILVRDLTVRLDPMPHAVGVVQSVDPSSGAFTLKMAGRKSMPFDHPEVLAHWTWGVLLDKNIPAKIKTNTPLVLSTKPRQVEKSIDAAGDTLYTLQLTQKSIAKYFEPGDKYVVFARNGGSGLAHNVNCRDITFLNITNYGSSGGHYAALEGSDLKVLGCKSLIPEGYWFGANADGLHVRSNDLGPWVEGCTFQGVGDDSVAIYKKGIFILKQESPTQLRVATQFFNLEVGHKIRIFNPRDGVGVEDATVAAIELQKQGHGDIKERHYLVTLSAPLKASLYTTHDDPLYNDQIFNRTLGNRDFVLRNNRFERIRRFGSIIRAGSGVIENNQYDRISNIPIVLRNEPDNWRNGLGSDHIQIINNTITNSGYAIKRENMGQIHLELYKMGRKQADGRLHRDIVISGNTIHNWMEHGISIHNADGVRVSDNTFTSDLPFDNDRPHFGVYVDNSANVQISDNHFDDSRSDYIKIEANQASDADATPTPAAASITPSARKSDAQSRPNILFYITDDESWFERSKYGVQATLKTPHFDRVADAGVLFTHAYASAPSCAPSRASVLTGRHFWQLKQGAFIQAYVPIEFPVLPHILAEHGYLTGHTGKGWGPGLYPKDIAHSNSMAGPEYNAIRLADPLPEMTSIDYVANFKQFLKTRQAGQPFFFWTGTTEPHGPYDKENYRRLEKEYGIKLDQVYLPDGMPDTVANRKDRANFWYEIIYADEQFGAMLDHLKSIGELDNTLIIVTSDNGTFIRGGKGKATAYEAATCEPLAVMYPAKMTGGRTVTDFVNFADFAPTMLEAAGITPPESMSGRSFYDVLVSNKSGRIDAQRDATVTGLEWHGELDPKSRSARTLHTDDFALIAHYANVDDNGQPLNNEAASTPSRYELYDLKKDPWQNNDLAKDPAYAERLAQLKKQLRQFGLNTSDPRVTGEMDTFRRTREFVLERKRSNYKKEIPIPKEFMDQAAAPAKTPPGKPNVIVFFTDDMGLGDVGAYGSKDIPTPYIDSIATNGILFTDGYVSCPQCAPSRAGLLTGRYQNRFGFEYNYSNAIPEDLEEAGLPLTEKTIATRLKPAGYATGIIGKWHQGYEKTEKYHPLNRGFDYFFGHLSGSSNYLPLGDQQFNPSTHYRNRDEIQISDYLTDVLGREIVDFIGNHKDEPFFIYVPFNAPHGPLQVTEKYLQRVKGIMDETRRTYAAMVCAVDDAVGATLSKLREEGLYENTMIFFLTDNGGRERLGGNNGIYRGGKGMMYEGGIRIPFLAQWPAVYPAGVKYEHPVISLDLLPTAVAAAGLTAPSQWKLDGVDLTPYLTNQQSGEPHEHEALCWRLGVRPVDSDDIPWAVRMDQWKLVWVRSSSLKPGQPSRELYDLANDPSEQYNLIASQPEIAERLEKEYQQWEAQMTPPAWKLKPQVVKH